MGIVKKLVPAEDIKLQKELGTDVLKLLFISTARAVAMGYDIDPNLLVADFDSTPVNPQFIFWNQVDAAVKSVKTCYALSQEECSQILADIITEILTLQVQEVKK